MAKRAFERRDGLLIDTYDLPSGKKCTVHLSGQSLGEPPSETQLQLARDSAAHQEDKRWGAHVLSWEEKDARALEALLMGVAAGNIAAPAALLKYLDDARVRPALVEATRVAAPLGLANVAQVLGIAGGPGAREVLRTRLAELLAAPETFEDAPFMNFAAGAAASVAQALLGLDAEDTAAAQGLRRLLSHACAHNRRNAAMCAAGAYRRGLKTEAMQMLESVLRPLVHDPDAQLFFAAIDALRVLEPQRVIDRCVSLLDDETVESIPLAASHLVGLPLTHNSIVPRLIAWISNQRVVRKALMVAHALGSLVPEPIRVDLVRHALADESPSLRWEAICALNSLERERAVELATATLRDEPDPALKKALSAFTGSQP